MPFFEVSGLVIDKVDRQQDMQTKHSPGGFRQMLRRHEVGGYRPRRVIDISPHIDEASQRFVVREVRGI